MSRAANLPGLPVLKTDDPRLNEWAKKVAEHIETRMGARGDPLERSLTLRDLTDGPISVKFFGGGRGQSGPGSESAADAAAARNNPDIDAIIRELINSPFFQSFIKRLDDPSRFDGLPERIRSLLLNDIAAEAAERGADIQLLDIKIQSEAESLAARINEVTAALSTAAAGVREVTFANATETRAQAGKVTQITAVLGRVFHPTVFESLAQLRQLIPVGDASKSYRVRTNGVLTVYRFVNGSYVVDTRFAGVEQSMFATADAVDGLSAQFTMKVQAGGAIAGIGLAATETAAGFATSAILLQADRIAVVDANYSGSRTAPSQDVVPFLIADGKTFIKEAFIKELKADKILSGTARDTKTLNKFFFSTSGPNPFGAGTINAAGGFEAQAADFGLVVLHNNQGYATASATTGTGRTADSPAGVAGLGGYTSAGTITRGFLGVGVYAGGVFLHKDGFSFHAGLASASFQANGPGTVAGTLTVTQNINAPNAELTIKGHVSVSALLTNLVGRVAALESKVGGTPPPGGTPPSSATASVTPTSISLGGSITVTLSGGTPGGTVTESRIVNSVLNAGGSVVLDSTGATVFTTQLNAQGSWRLTFSGAGFASPANDLAVTVGASGTPPVTTPTITFSPLVSGAWSVGAGGAVSISFAGGTPNATVSYFVAFGGNIVLQGAVTLSSAGVGSISFTAPSTLGNYGVSFAGGGFNGMSNVLAVTSASIALPTVTVAPIVNGVWTAAVGAQVTLNITGGASGGVVTYTVDAGSGEGQRLNLTLGSNGQGNFPFTAPSPASSYTLRFRSGETVIATRTLVVTAASSGGGTPGTPPPATATPSSSSVFQSGTMNISVTGLPNGEIRRTYTVGGGTPEGGTAVFNVTNGTLNNFISGFSRLGLVQVTYTFNGSLIASCNFTVIRNPGDNTVEP